MAKKPPSGSPKQQIGVRMDSDLVARIEQVARQIGTDRSHLIRMLIIAGLPEYEARARRTRPAESD